MNPQLQKKKCKCQEFLFEIKQWWQINKIIVIPLIVSATGVIPDMLNQNLTTPTLMPCLCPRSINWSYWIPVPLWENSSVHLCDEEASNPF